MININIAYTRDLITEIKVQGHASSSAIETKLCAAISAVTTGGANALKKIGNNQNFDINLKNGSALLKINLPVFELTVVLETIY